MTVLELAYSGADLAGVVTFHGSLTTPRPEDEARIKPRFLVLHGAEDTFVKPESVTAFQDALRRAKADWQIWITAGSRPLPRKVVITSRTDEARPQSVSLIDWNLKPTFKDTVFKFTPPKGASKIEIVPVKTK